MEGLQKIGQLIKKIFIRGEECRAVIHGSKYLHRLTFMTVIRWLKKCLANFKVLGFDGSYSFLDLIS